MKYLFLFLLFFSSLKALDSSSTVYPIAIIGAGAAGTMAAKRAVLNDNAVVLFTGALQEQRRSRGTWVRTVDNIPGLERYSRTLLELRNETLSDLMQSPLRRNLTIVENSVLSIEKSDTLFKLTDRSGHTLFAQYVVLATGMMDEQPLIRGSIRPILPFSNGQTVAYCALCDGHRCFGKPTAIIGYGETAGSLALLLAEKYHPPALTLLTNGHAPQFSEEMTKHFRAFKIAIHTSPIYDVFGHQAGQLSGFKLENGETVDAQMAFVALGIRPNNQLALQLGASVDGRGLVLTNHEGESSVPNLFVIGDLRAESLKQIYTAWQHAVETLQVINRRIRESCKSCKDSTPSVGSAHALYVAA